jgi:PAS domain S-box-containing protein
VSRAWFHGRLRVTPVAVGNGQPLAGVVRRIEMCARIGLIAAGGTAALVLAGWIASIPILERSGLHGTPMSADTALSILLLAAAAATLPSARHSGWARAVCYSCGLAVFALAGLTVVERAFAIRLGIDQMFAHDSSGGLDPGRIPSQAVFSLLALGLALLFVERGGGRRASLRPLVALVACVPPALGVIGYASGSQVLYHLPDQAQMAPVTAVALVLLAWAFLAVRIAEGGFGLVTLDSAGGRLARRVLPATIGVPVCLGLLRRLGEAGGVFTPEVGLWLMISSAVVILACVAWHTARQVEVADRARRSAQHALLAERDGFAAVIAAQHDGVIVVSAAGVLIDANPALCRMTGFSSEDLIGCHEPLPFIRAEDEAKLKAYHRAEATGDGDEDIVLLHKDGSGVPVIFASAPLRNESGVVTARVTTVKDVSERHRGQEHRRKTNEQFAALIETAPDAAVIADPDGRIYLINTETERMFGYPRDELLGRPLEVLLPERLQAVDAEDGSAATLDPQTRSPTDVGMNLFGRRKDGTEFPIDVSRSTLDTDDGRLVTAFVRDITTLRQIEDERAHLHAELGRRADDLVRSNADLEQFANIASHDLAEPLRSISGFTQLLERRYKGQLDEDADRFIGFVVDGVNRMQMLIADLLAYSRAGRAELEVQPVALTEVVTDLLASLSSAIDEVDAEISVGHLPTVVADETQLGQVLQNLVCNALKFHQPGVPPRLEISAAQVESGWQVAVSDNGLGIDPAHSDRVFKMFQRLHGRDDYAGTGVGLAVCKRLVERLGGQIWFEPNTSQGTVFNFTIPTAGDGADIDITRRAA